MRLFDSELATGVIYRERRLDLLLTDCRAEIANPEPALASAFALHSFLDRAERATLWRVR